MDGQTLIVCTRFLEANEMDKWYTRLYNCTRIIQGKICITMVVNVMEKGESIGNDLVSCFGRSRDFHVGMADGFNQTYFFLYPD